MFREIRRLNKIQKGALFICDIQEKFRPNIKYFDQMVASTATMFKFAQIMEYPVAVTEQFARGLGPTVEELAEARPFVLSDKTQFSMMTPEVDAFMEEHAPSDIFICGIEAHACIQGTVQDLIERGIKTHVIVDAVSASHQVNRFSAFREMENIGATLVTSEQVILQTLSDAKHPKEPVEVQDFNIRIDKFLIRAKFKPAQQLLIKYPMQDSGLETFF